MVGCGRTARLARCCLRPASGVGMGRQACAGCARTAPRARVGRFRLAPAGNSRRMATARLQAPFFSASWLVDVSMHGSMKSGDLPSVRAGPRAASLTAEGHLRSSPNHHDRHDEDQDEDESGQIPTPCPCREFVSNLPFQLQRLLHAGTTREVIVAVIAAGHSRTPQRFGTRDGRTRSAAMPRQPARVLLQWVACGSARARWIVRRRRPRGL